MHAQISTLAVTDVRDFRFGAFRVSPAVRRLYRNDASVRLPQKAVDVLLALVLRCDTTVSKQELIDAAWTDGIASDAALTKVIFMLRSALSDEADRVQTVTNSGYRFTGPVERIELAARERDLCAQGRVCELLGTQAGYHAAIEFYEAAARADERSVEPLLGLGRNHLLIAHEACEEPWPHLEQLKKAALQAHRLAPEDPDTIVMRIHSLVVADRDIKTACVLYDAHGGSGASAALRMTGAQVALLDGRYDDVARYLDAESDAGSIAHASLRAQLAYFSGDASSAPHASTNGAVEHYYIAANNAVHGRYDEAAEQLVRIYRDEVAFDRFALRAIRQRAMALLVYCEASRNRKGEANRLMADLMLAGQRTYVAPLTYAIAAAALGNTDIALRFIEEAVLRRDPAVLYLRQDPFFAKYRDNDSFARLCASLFEA